jgi:hypothetical protein
VIDLVLDTARSTARIRTFAEGLLARLAHDLELSCGELSGSVTPEGQGGTATIEAPLRAFAVAGIVGKDGRVDERGLSPTERRDVIAKMQHEVFHASTDGIVRIEAKLDGEATSARVRVVPPNGKTVELSVRADIRREGDTVQAKGSFDVSLSAIGSDVVKGPMNAFRVKDKVNVSFDVVFVRSG